MFDEYTEEYFMEQARIMGEDLGVDTRQGSVYMDAATGHCMRAAKFYEDMRMAFNMMFIDSCTGEVLDERAGEKQIFRKQATPSYYLASFDGVPVEDLVGYRFMSEGYYFNLIPFEDGFYLQSEVYGEETNYLKEGSSVVPVQNIMNLSAATLGSLYMAGVDQEDDISLRERYKASIQGPAENGNKQQYKTWCEEYEGVGRTIITPLAYGPNTVKALIIGSSGNSPSASLVQTIQMDIDPDSAGLGEGKALIGCKVYIVGASDQQINISFDAILVGGYTEDTVKSAAVEELKAYLKKVALDTSDDEVMLIQYVKIVGILADTPGIKDFSNLQLNGESGNIEIDTDYVGILGEVSMNVSV